MALGLSLQLAFNDFVLQVCKALRSCSDSTTLRSILQDLLDLATISRANHADHSETQPPASSSQLARALHKLQRELHRDPAAKRSITSGFLQHLEVITCTLLPGELYLTAH